ncbi:RNA helicase [Cryptococcus bacillisporus CA1873]|uniref:RNA helicase n=1 Tax=Cryptococcus bacillisporus CA1873 TaxID=1296111 RepID=A0ABR5B6N5_CRYGA|nr:RNA helicase [Cryptococcus bacillisporus CA1873]|eukprot:KIR59260.1 RNA helicase [Cryptococcus gattii CA1873]
MSVQHYLGTLFQPQPPTLEDSWKAVISSWGSSQFRAQAVDDVEPVLDTSPWPSVLDYLSITGLPSVNLEPPPIESAPESSLSTRADLVDRLRQHIPTTFGSFVNLLSTPRSNDDIQSELIEIMGFEGDALSLIEELLKPGARQNVVDSCLRYTPSEQDKNEARPVQTDKPAYLPNARMAVKKKVKDKKKVIDISDIVGSAEDIKRRLQEQIEGPNAMFSEDGPKMIEQEILPHVYTVTGKKFISLSHGGKFALPEGTKREYTNVGRPFPLTTYEEVIIPPANPVPPKKTERPVKIAELSPMAGGCFPKYIQLNRMQSIVQPTAMNTNENMLICAPTGAGKTDVAIMAIIRVLSQHVIDGPTSHPSGFNIERNSFKIIYVAPMKALASEIVSKFAKRLAWLSIKVRELTGDMQLTKQEIEETQIIVTTPEKWDVVTRKPTGEGELASKVKLLIIDEVHLLAEDRGAVIETIVARTLRQVESRQSLIRIVGLSATLPNYVDVGDFLRVNRHQGLFYFDASFRPIPLEQHFIGVSGKPRSAVSARNMDRVVFEKVSELVEAGHQVMVFVHARRDTVKTAQTLKEMALEEGVSTFFQTDGHAKFSQYRAEISKSKNKEMKELFDAGFGIHHAGMLRTDRNMMEKMFGDGCINVLCCTSTLAWGVNLPAHAVVIKGTQVYDTGKGSFMDLSVLDVLQIFGRAGRPGYATSGVGFICTTHDKVDHYVTAVMSQTPIESKFIPGMTDALNAEVALGTITNVQEAMQWLSYTYLFVRMKKNPWVYAMAHDVTKDDPQLGNKRNELIVQAARLLQKARMVRYDDLANTFGITDLGRIAAKYYLRFSTIEIFNSKFNPRMSNADLFQMLCEATEFEQIQLRDSEVEELEAIIGSGIIPLEVTGGAINKRNKVNILLQAHISNVYINDFALVSDAAFVAQNAGRIIRALLEIALSRNWANCSYLLVELSKCIERRQWVYDHGLAQLKVLQREIIHKLTQYTPDSMTISDFRDMTAQENGEFIHMNEKHGQAVLDAAMMFPTVNLTHTLRPITHDLLQITVKVTPQFKWHSKISGSSEPFYVWVQDEEGLNIYQWRNVRVTPSTTAIIIDFFLPFDDVPPDSISIISISDKWLWSYEQLVIQLSDLIMPPPPKKSTQILGIPFLRRSCFNDPQLEQRYAPTLDTLNTVQSHAFWMLYNTSMNAVISAPVGSGKTLLAEGAVWNAFRHNKESVVLIIVPERYAVHEAVARLRNLCPPKRRVVIKTLFNMSDFEQLLSGGPAIGVTTPFAILSNDKIDNFLNTQRLGLYVFEDLHLLDEVYELAVSKILTFARTARTRIVGTTSSLNDPSDLAEWLGVDPGPLDQWGKPVASQPPALFSFAPSDRDSHISVSIKSFTIPHGPTLLRAMIKPTYDILKSVTGGAIIFVPSVQACATVAADLVTQSGTEMNLNGFLSRPRHEIEPFTERLKDERLFEPMLHGIGYITRDMAPTDLAIVLELFASGIIRAIIAPRQSCWTLPVRGGSVIIMGTQYVRVSARPEDKGAKAKPGKHLVSYSAQELVKMQGFAVASAAPTALGGRMFIMCPTEQQVMISRMLKEGLPLESKILDLLSRRSIPSSSVDPRAIQALTNLFKGRRPPPRPTVDRPLRPDGRKADMMDIVNWSFLFVRMKSNPSYYQLIKGSEAEGISRVIGGWFDSMDGVKVETVEE